MVADSNADSKIWTQDPHQLALYMTTSASHVDSTEAFVRPEQLAASRSAMVKLFVPAPPKRSFNHRVPNDSPIPGMGVCHIEFLFYDHYHAVRWQPGPKAEVMWRPGRMF